MHTQKTAIVCLCLMFSCASANAGESALRVSCDEDATGAEISLDGIFKGECPVDFSVSEGSHVLSAIKKLGEEKTRKYESSFRIGDGVIKRLDIILGPPQLTELGRQRENEIKYKAELANLSNGIIEKIKTDYVDVVDDAKLEELKAFVQGQNIPRNGDINKFFVTTVNAMLAKVDSYSAYLDAAAFKELQEGTQGEFGGLGIELGMEDGFVKVVSPLEDTPAYKSGVKAEDLIVKLDDQPVKGMALNDAVKMMRGKVGSDITLTIVRKGVEKPITLTITRAVIKIKSVKYKLVEPGYGYVRITQFQAHTGENLVNALKNLGEQNKGQLKGLVLDLRYNPGGLLNTAVSIASAFLKTGDLVVYTDGRSEDAKMRLTNARENYLRSGESDYLKELPFWVKSVPLVVLVNKGTAGTSEIVASALQDHKRATVLGTQTFGKGSVQTIFSLRNGGAIKLTAARYFTPNGHTFEGKGITPDLIVPENPKPDTGVDSQLARALEIFHQEAARQTGLRLQQQAVTEKALANLQSKGMAPGDGKAFRDCPECPELVLIPPGIIEMGGEGHADETPVHKVEIGYVFAMGKTEITQAQWKAVMNNNPSKYKGGWFSSSDDLPVENVSWHDAQEFLRRLSAKTGQQYRLPSEAEWEYACRAGGHHTYCGGEDLDALGWHDRNSGRETHRVAGKQANAWGLYDMSGNVDEWVQDCMNVSYSGAPSDGNAWTTGDCDRRVLRGGSWLDEPGGARASNRSGGGTSARYFNTGFRPARTITP